MAGASRFSGRTSPDAGRSSRTEKKGRSPPNSPQYSSPLKASRGSSEASEVEDDDMGFNSDGEDELELNPKLEWSEALQLFKDQHFPQLLAQGWTREQISQGSRPHPDQPGSFIVCPRPRNTPGGRRTYEEWCRPSYT